MKVNEDEFLKSLRDTFAVEAGEHVQAISSGLLSIEQSTSDEAQRSHVGTIYRHAHSLKGAARAVNFTDIEAVCQSMEEVLAAWKQGEATPTPLALDAVHGALDEISKALSTPETTVAGKAALSAQAKALRRLKSVRETTRLPREERPEEPVPSGPLRPERQATSDTVRIAINKLEGCLLKTEEILSAKLAVAQHASDLRNLTGEIEEWKKEWRKIQPSVNSLHPRVPGPNSTAAITTVTNFLEWNQNYFRTLENKVDSLARATQRDQLNISKLVDDLLEDSKKLLMLPVATLGPPLAKLVRDLCRQQGKEANFVMSGEEVEIDKRILDEIKDPLIHLVRNCVDHGIELPAVRSRLNKPAAATIALKVSPVDGNKVQIAVEDDGGGINEEKVKQIAVNRQVITAREAESMSNEEAQRLIFQPELSTSAIITELSGRGLGLAIVREVTEKLGGQVGVEAKKNAGSKIQMTIPLALATFRGIIVEVEGRTFVIPTAQVERVSRFSTADIKTVEGRETVVIKDRPVSLVRLSAILELPPANGSPENNLVQVIVLGSNEQRVAFTVDAIVDEQEVLVKHFCKPLVRVRCVAGATILVSGRVAPVLNVADLLKAARGAGIARTRVNTQTATTVVESKSILIAEDSITSRMLLKGILESAGYTVTTAVDGMEAFTKLRSESFDLLVSDVEMPRLNGFDLTARVRADNKLAALPVILVTALEKREDRERGIDVGANAYLVKSSFDQSNLLEAVRRLT